MDVYRELHRRSIADPEAFWAEAAEAVTWDRDPVRVLDSDRPRSTAGSPTPRSTPAATP